ncbi:enoyl-CoA hydratase/isomerase family protein [Neobacillus pocheonensis]|uniref:enoyl-CoA hydratase/isomerase family protein n=1 Tax=Neobacillus pocheonensis TaxID=363869 RepID=UPI003D2BD732
MYHYETLLITEPKDGLLEVTLSRPKQLNALNMLMIDELFHLTSELRGPLLDKYHAIIFSGAGRAFCSGGDLKEFLGIYEKDHSTIENYISKFLRLSKVLYELPIPTIASLHGAVAGGGASIALACDIRIAAKQTNIQFNFSRIGLIPDMGAHYFLPLLIGEANSLEVLYTGRPILSEEALKIGLIHQVAEGEDLKRQTFEYASQFENMAPQVFRHIKQLIKNRNYSLDQILNLETIIQTERFKSKEFGEAIGRFFEK